MMKQLQLFQDFHTQEELNMETNDKLTWRDLLEFLNNASEFNLDANVRVVDIETGEQHDCETVAFDEDPSTLFLGINFE